MLMLESSTGTRQIERTRVPRDSLSGLKGMSSSGVQCPALNSVRIRTASRISTASVLFQKKKSK